MIAYLIPIAALWVGVLVFVLGLCKASARGDAHLNQREGDR